MEKAHKTIEPIFEELEFCNELMIIDARGVLFWPAEQMMIVSDLHLEKGSSFAARGRGFVPPYDSRVSLTLLSECARDWEPKRILSLGDSFHDADGAGRLDDRALLLLKELMFSREWVWISGNHDPSPPKDLGGMFASQLMLGQLNFVHEPRETFTIGEIAGHLHPCAKIRRRGKSVRRRCLVGDGYRLILPAFGAFTGGLNIRDQAYDGLFSQSDLRAWLLGSDRVYCIDGKELVR